LANDINHKIQRLTFNLHPTQLVIFNEQNASRISNKMADPIKLKIKIKLNYN